MSESQPQAGWYKCRGVAGSFVLSQSAKAHSDQVEFRVNIPALGGEFQAKPLSFSGNAGPYSLDKLRALGWTGSTSTAFDGCDANLIDCEIKYETYNGKTQMVVEISSLGGGSEVMVPKLANAFMTRLSELDKRTPRAAGTPQRQTQTQTQSGGSGNRGAADPYDGSLPLDIG